MEEMILEVLGTLFLGLAGIAVKVLHSYLKRLGVIEFIDAKERIVEKAVAFLAVSYEDLSGEDFRNAAIKRASKRLKENGINVTKEELNDLVDETIEEIRDMWEKARK